MVVKRSLARFGAAHQGGSRALDVGVRRVRRPEKSGKPGRGRPLPLREVRALARVAVRGERDRGAHRERERRVRHRVDQHAVQTDGDCRPHVAQHVALVTEPLHDRARQVVIDRRVGRVGDDERAPSEGATGRRSRRTSATFAPRGHSPCRPPRLAAQSRTLSISSHSPSSPVPATDSIISSSIRRSPGASELRARAVGRFVRGLVGRRVVSCRIGLAGLECRHDRDRIDGRVAFAIVIGRVSHGKDPPYGPSPADVAPASADAPSVLPAQAAAEPSAQATAQASPQSEKGPHPERHRRRMTLARATCVPHTGPLESSRSRGLEAVPGRSGRVTGRRRAIA